MGYGLMIFVLVAVAAMLFVTFVGSGAKKPPAGKIEPQGDLSASEPASETVNPSESSTASSAQAEQARKHTPPA